MTDLYFGGPVTLLEETFQLYFFYPIPNLVRQPLKGRYLYLRFAIWEISCLF